MKRSGNAARRIIFALPMILIPAWATSAAAHASDSAADAAQSPGSTAGGDEEQLKKNPVAKGNGQPSDDAAAAIVVTARRRQENAQKVPIAMTVLSQDTLTKNNVQTIQDLQHFVPSLSLQSQGLADQQTIVLRGQGRAFAAPYPGVITFMDEVPLPSLGGQSWAGPGLFFDLANVQVLKGPQGTLFGRNSVGGDILLVTAKPTDQFGGYLSGTYGNYNDREITAVMNVPISDALKTRVAFTGQWRDGYNHIEGEPSHPNGVYGANRNTWGVRASVTYRPSSMLENDLVFEYTTFDQVATPARVINITGSAADLFFPEYSLLKQQQAQLGPREYLPISVDDRIIEDLLVISNVTRVNLTDNLIFRNILGFGSTHEWLTLDQDGTNLPLFDFPVNAIGTNQPPLLSAQKQLTEEAQLQGRSFNDRLQWTVGGFIQHPFSAPTTARAMIFGGPTPEGATDDRQYSKAIYAQATFALTPKLKLTGGARETWDHDTQVTRGNLPTSVCEGRKVDCGDATAVRNEASSKAFSYTINLEYQVTPSTLLYAAARSGYHPGGFNAYDVVRHFQPPPYGPEHVQDRELGIKTTFNVGGARVRINADGWYQNYTGIQLLAVVPEPITPFNPVGNATFTINAGKAHFYGAELEGELSMGAWTLSGTFDYIKKKYVSFVSGVSQSTIDDLKSSATLAAPKYKYTLGAQYRLPVPAEVGDLTAGVHWAWESSNGDRSVINGLGLTKAHGLLNADLSWNSVYGRPFDISVFGSNLLNKTFVVTPVENWQPGFFGGLAFYNEPRMYGARLTYHFGEGR